MLNTLLVFRKKCKYTTCFPVSSSLVSPSLFRVPSSEGLRRQGRKGQSNRFKCSIFCCFHFLVDFTIIKLLTIFKFELDVHSALPSFLPSEAEKKGNFDQIFEWRFRKKLFSPFKDYDTRRVFYDPLRGSPKFPSSFLCEKSKGPIIVFFLTFASAFGSKNFIHFVSASFLPTKQRT